MRAPFHPYGKAWLFTISSHAFINFLVYVSTSEDLISKDFMVGRVSRLGHMEVEGGTVDYETSVRRVARPVTSFCEMKVELCPLHL